MKKLLISKMQGLKRSLMKFAKKIEDFKVGSENFGEFMDIVSAEMKDLPFDNVTKDKAGNLIGEMKGYGDKEAVVMMSHVDIMPPVREKLEGLSGNGMVRFKAGIVSSLYAAALMKRAMLPLTGDLVVCCVPRFECCDLGVKYLFDDLLKSRLSNIKGVMLCEPTGFNVNLGHKGRMEYEIVVRGKLKRNFLENRGMNMLGTMFPLINELEKVSKDMPNDLNMGRSDLRIKDVLYNGYRPEDEMNEFRVVVDRVYIPEENEGAILNKAKTIARSVYCSEPEVTVSTMLAKERFTTHTGLELVSEKEFKPWVMESHKPFALESLKCLTESGFKSDFGFWRKIVTEGSYTCAELNLPTIGFGAGSEEEIYSGAEEMGLDKLERAVYGQALIIQRNIGMPTFGWSSDSI
jgi:acetylornithine deacetylase/succinyl-diaminopimelate desuccinylase-like protein